jgi:hypothetical protein
VRSALRLCTALLLGAGAWPAAAAGEPPAPSSAAAAPAPASRLPQILAAQYTYIEQRQSTLTSPYQGKLSLLPEGDRQATHTIGFYTGWAPFDWGQLYFDTEKFMGAGVSGATGLGGLSNGDVIRQGVPGLKKQFYVARAYVRLMWPLGGATVDVARSQDQIAGTEAATRLELKIGQLAVSDDFDHNRYAGAARTQFLNWALWNNTAWDFAADTRGYTDGFVIGYVSPVWSLKYGMYRMPLYANGQTLESLNSARGENLELSFTAPSLGTVLRLLVYRNTARMGIYEDALAAAAASGTVPDIVADDAPGRHKSGLGLNAEQPLADDGDSGLFMRLGWNDGKTESFVFTEVDQHASVGGQLAGSHWGRAADRLGLGIAVQGISPEHRAYLAAGGCGFLLCDGRLNYAREEILEAYYRAQWSFAPWGAPLRLQLSPDLQYVANPGYNHDRGPVHFYALRVHLEY